MDKQVKEKNIIVEILLLNEARIGNIENII